MRQLRRRYPKLIRFLAYFQPATNTYAPIDRLRRLYFDALDHPQVVGLVIGTRPDCVPDEVLDLMASWRPRTFVSVEYGMQTMHERSLAWMNRGHGHEAFIDAVERSRGRGFEIGAHVILGLPGETHGDMLATARELARLGIGAVKIHNLYAVKNTPLADCVRTRRSNLAGSRPNTSKRWLTFWSCCRRIAWWSASVVTRRRITWWGPPGALTNLPCGRPSKPSLSEGILGKEGR